LSSSPALLGGTAGVCTAVLAIAAHGAAGGGMPSGAAAALLVAVAVGVGITGAHHPVLPPTVLLAAGQIASHVALSSVTDDHTHTTAPMIAAHVLAVAGCALLLGVADRLHSVCARTIRLASTPLPTAAAPPAALPVHPTMLHRGIVFPSTISVRGPPATATAVS